MKPTTSGIRFELLFCQLVAQYFPAESLCVLTDCSIPRSEPFDQNCTLQHMLKSELALSEEQTSDDNSRGIILDLSSSAADSACVKLYIGTVNTKATSEIKLTATLMCKSIAMFYSTFFKLVYDNRTGHLQCIRPYYERTDSCTSFPENRLRLTADDSSFVVENVDPDGELIGRSSFLTQNESENWIPRCNCGGFESMLQRYNECVWKLHTKRDALVVAQQNMAYGVAAIFVTIFVITVVTYKFCWRTVV